MEHNLNKNPVTEVYRHQFRNDFISHIKNSKLQGKHCSEPKPAQQYKEQGLETQQKMHAFDTNFQSKPQRRQTHSRTCGGDADRALYDSAYNLQQYNDSYRQRNTGDNYSLKQLHCNPKASAPALPTNVNTPIGKYNTKSIAVDECAGGYRNSYENDYNLGGIHNGSEESFKSQNSSSKTVVSRKSSHDLRKMVLSQCKLHEEIAEAVSYMSNTNNKLDANEDDKSYRLNEPISTQYPLTLSPCKHCSDRVHPRRSQKNVMTEIDKRDLLECRNTDTLTISVDDVVNSKVINPMIRKLQRMYLNNLQEEMSLMEDLERLPHKVNEVYKATILKQKD